MQLAPAPRPDSPNDELRTVYVRRPHAQPGDLPLLVVKILGLLDGRRTTSEIFEDAQISADKGLAIVRKLSRLGMIETAPTRPGRTKVSDPCPSALERAETLRGLPALPRQGFTAAEEAFFASEVEGSLEDEEEPSGLGYRLSLLISDLVLYLRRDVAL